MALHSSLSAFGAAILLASCSTTTIVGPEVCPIPAPITSEQQKTLGEEIAALPPFSSIVKYMIDYFKVRKELEACRNAG